MSTTVETASEIRPFHVDVPEEELTDLRRRIAATRWPEKETVADHSQGVPLAMTEELANYWATDYDWRECEAKLNALPQFITQNITLYWLTNTGVSASRLYWEYKGGFFNAKGVSIPVAVSVFPGEQYEAPRSWTERAYPNLIHYNVVDKGGHFAAWEQPELFSDEVRTGLRKLR
jgi:pimeloyl-ACP methyl ester carboxylesterase